LAVLWLLDGFGQPAKACKPKRWLAGVGMVACAGEQVTQGFNSQMLQAISADRAGETTLNFNLITHYITCSTQPRVGTPVIKPI
jgi:hypothetical protein